MQRTCVPTNTVAVVILLRGVEGSMLLVCMAIHSTKRVTIHLLTVPTNQPANQPTAVTMMKVQCTFYFLPLAVDLDLAAAASAQQPGVDNNNNNS